MKIFVTGAGGFIGTRLVKELKDSSQPVDILCLVRSEKQAEKLRRLGAKVLIGDLTDAESYSPELKKCEYVFHLAAEVPFRHVNSDQSSLERNNVRALEVLLQNLPAGSIQKFVLMSSFNAVERPPGDLCRTPVNEQSQCFPQTAYGKTKRQAEILVSEFCTRQKIPFLILRPPSIVFGSGASPDSGISKIIKGVQRRSFFLTLNFPGEMSYIHVQDLARETVRLGLEKSFCNSTYFLMNESPAALSEWVQAIAELSGIPVRMRRIPAFFYNFLNRCLLAIEKAGLGRLIPIQFLMLLRDYSVADCSLAKRETGFRTVYSLRQGISEMLTALKDAR